MWVHDLARADTHCGGKALGLARLLSAGLPVPAGFVIDDHAFRHVAGDIVLDDPQAVGHVIAQVLDRFATVALPDEVSREIDARADALPAPDGFAVRSSATIEDRNVGAAAGVFSSKTAVPRADLWHAIRGVWVSALTPLAVTYARRRGGPIAIGVIVQAYVAGERITVYTRRPASPAINEVLVQRDTSIARLRRESTDPAVVLALRAEAALGASAGADVELVGEHVVQARPIVHPPRRPQRSVAPPTVTSLLAADGRTWTWDIAHNPDPLSTAQSELVERVDRAGVAPYSLRVCAGYLYSAPRTQVTAPAADQLAEIESRLAALVGDLGIDSAGVTGPRTKIGEGLENRPRTPTDRGLERKLRATTDVGLESALPVEEALDRYVKFYAIWSSELSPLVAALRRPSSQLSSPSPRRSSVEALLLGVARGELDEANVMRRLGVLSPSWDVAVPTYAERPELLRDALTRARELVKVPRSAPSGIFRRIEPDAAVREHAASADLAERDDYWFARAQWMVRRALIARGRELGLDDGDVFWLPLAVVADGVTVDDSRRRAAAAKTAAARAARWEMPLVVGAPDLGDVPLRSDAPRDTLPEGRRREPSYGPPGALTAQARGDHALRGIGSGGRVQGRVVRFASLASSVTVGRGDVVVARAITPALAVMVIGCAAIVSETGGFLDHGAAMARELGIPCVVGCKDAWSILDDGMLVTVDGDSGLVTTHG
ncbi:MAG: PEP-utilizing enzyme [Kofleriaceae bacterium]